MNEAQQKFAEEQSAANLAAIVNELKNKGTVKQEVYRNTREVFQEMKTCAAAMVEDIKKNLSGVDESVKVDFKDVSKFEFQVKLSGELLVCSMHSNVVKFPEEHILNTHPYIQEEYGRQYFGAIQAYNFLADSLKYNRDHDPGYLIARMFVNKENHFYIEGVKQLNFLYPNIAENELNKHILTAYIESAIIAAMDNDSVMPNFEQMRVISVGQKRAMTMLGGVEKVGFQMTTSVDPN